jgi:hypothetical protein
MTDLANNGIIGIYGKSLKHSYDSSVFTNKLKLNKNFFQTAQQPLMLKITIFRHKLMIGPPTLTI